MPIPIAMPQLSPTMTEGTLARWLKSEGDQVSPGDVIAEIETDKATMEIEIADDGVLAKILVAEGTEGVAVGTVIAVLLEEGEDTSVLEGFAAKAGRAQAAPDQAPATAPPSPPASEPALAPAPEAVPQPVAAAPAQAVAPATPAQAAAPATPGGDGEGRILASPLARRMARQAGLELARIKGSGPHGRIVKADVEAALAAAIPAAPPAVAAAPEAIAAVSAPAVAPPPAAEYEAIPHSNMRKIIARRLTEAKQTIPHFYLTIDCEIDALLGLRKDLNNRSDEYKLTVNDFVVRAAALALRKVPAANASWTEAAILRYNTVDVAVAVATERGLITPIVRNADQKGLATIANEMKGLAARAREGKLMPEEYQGGTFSVSNLGMYGIREFSAVINPPHGAILAVGAGAQRPVVTDGALGIATMMTCTLSCDHRVVDGTLGSEFLAALKGYIEDPITMLL